MPRGDLLAYVRPPLLETFYQLREVWRDFNTKLERGREEGREGGREGEKEREGRVRRRERGQGGKG